MSSSGGITGVSGAGANFGVRSSGADVMETYAHLLKVQADVVAAQAKAVAVQNLPALSCYTGDDGFENPSRKETT
jgi:hypothetical protein